MDDSDKLDPPTDFSTESSWTLGADSDTMFNSFFQDRDRESTILSEFGWNLQPDNITSHTFVDFDRIQNNFAGASTFPATSRVTDDHNPSSNIEAQTGPTADNNQSVSSSTSEDLPEKSTASASSTEKVAPETT